MALPLIEYRAVPGGRSETVANFDFRGNARWTPTATTSEPLVFGAAWTAAEVIAYKSGDIVQERRSHHAGGAAETELRTRLGLIYQRRKQELLKDNRLEFTPGSFSTPWSGRFDGTRWSVN